MIRFFANLDLSNNQLLNADIFRVINSTELFIVNSTTTFDLINISIPTRYLKQGARFSVYVLGSYRNSTATSEISLILEAQGIQFYNSLSSGILPENADRTFVLEGTLILSSSISVFDGWLTISARTPFFGIGLTDLSQNLLLIRKVTGSFSNPTILSQDLNFRIRSRLSAASSSFRRSLVIIQEM